MVRPMQSDLISLQSSGFLRIMTSNTSNLDMCISIRVLKGPWGQSWGLKAGSLEPKLGSKAGTPKLGPKLERPKQGPKAGDPKLAQRSFDGRVPRHSANNASKEKAWNQPGTQRWEPKLVLYMFLFCFVVVSVFF